MLAYASNRRFAERRQAPQAMLAILAAHIAAIAVVMSAKMDIPQKIQRTITEVTFVDPIATPPETPKPQPPREHTSSTLDQVPALVPTPTRDPVQADPVPVPIPDIRDGPAIDPLPPVQEPVRPALEPVRVGPRFATPAALVRPPYPLSKIEREEEASLRLRLTIDARGRVIAVEPIGRADPAFLDAARRHLMARWRYQPATEDGRAIASETVITLRFELD